MVTKSILGSEYDWIACDGDGHVAFFSTAGGGLAPDGFLRDTDAHDHAIDLILALAPRTTANCELEMTPELENTWLMMAERGIFAFDSDSFGGPYRLVASPGEPIQVDQLPGGAADVARRLRYPELQFARLRTVSDAMLRTGKTDAAP